MWYSSGVLVGIQHQRNDGGMRYWIHNVIKAMNNGRVYTSYSVDTDGTVFMTVAGYYIRYSYGRLMWEDQQALMSKLRSFINKSNYRYIEDWLEGY